MPWGNNNRGSSFSGPWNNNRSNFNGPGNIAVQAQASTAPGIVVPETTTTAATSICHGEITIAAQTLVPGVIMVMVAGSAGNKLAGAVLSMHAPALI